MTTKITEFELDNGDTLVKYWVDSEKVSEATIRKGKLICVKQFAKAYGFPEDMMFFEKPENHVPGDLYTYLNIKYGVKSCLKE